MLWLIGVCDIIIVMVFVCCFMCCVVFGVGVGMLLGMFVVWLLFVVDEVGVFLIGLGF